MFSAAYANLARRLTIASTRSARSATEPGASPTQPTATVEPTRPIPTVEFAEQTPTAEPSEPITPTVESAGAGLTRSKSVSVGRGGGAVGGQAGVAPVRDVTTTVDRHGVAHLWVGMSSDAVIADAIGARIAGSTAGGVAGGMVAGQPLRSAVAVVHGIGFAGGLGALDGLAEAVRDLQAAGVSQLVVLAREQWRAQQNARHFQITIWATSERLFVSTSGGLFIGDAIVDQHGKMQVAVKAVPHGLRRYTPNRRHIHRRPTTTTTRHDRTRSLQPPRNIHPPRQPHPHNPAQRLEHDPDRHRDPRPHDPPGTASRPLWPARYVNGQHVHSGA